ncbi:adenylate cyclase [Tistlia consotensis]|uniref:Adenylate cyclase n=1 Tax=Tistlia consotensis USBA 355 TaxID=560819 RepID=A0A1Y6C681_9PROT|nr:adenylate/guanylate cyclase domain-containing protein [Tistlia consotensis]SMF38474.1 adenylate cyclase [Tistlia consotensis USBA 355]SNR37134.1 adenylate cyclase [Tistlia consotensis]
MSVVPVPERRFLRRIRLSIASVLTLGLGSLMLAALAAVALVTLGASERNTTDLLRKFSEVTIGSINLQVERYLSNARRQATFVADAIASGRVPLAGGDSLTELVEGSMGGVPQVRGMAVFTADGQELRIGRFGSDVRVERGDWRSDPVVRSFMQRMRDGEGQDQRTVVWVPEFGEATVAVDAPIRKDGEFLGAVSSVVGLTDLSAFLHELSHEYDGTAFILYGRDQVLAHPTLSGGMRGTSLQHPLPTLTEIQDPVLGHIWDDPDDTLNDLLAGTDLSGHTVEVKGELMVYVYRQVEGLSVKPWLIGAYFKGDAVAAPVKRLIGSAMVAGGIVLLSLILAVLIGRAIARPIKGLAASATAIEGLQFDRVPAPPSSFFRELDVAGQSFEAMLAGLRLFETYVPKRLVERLMTRGVAATHSETREVTVLFTDIVGFTGLAENLPADSAAAFLNGHFGLLGSCIEAEDGTIDKYIGDSVMAFWGAPLDQPDHAARACRAALAIAGAITADNARRGSAGEPPVQLRIGVHSGPAIVGNIGARGRVNYTLVGDTVNTAQRLEGLGREFPSADDVQVLISGDTRTLLPEGFVSEPLGRVQLRGRSGDTLVFRLRAGPPALPLSPPSAGRTAGSSSP